jgi:PilZ domain
MESEVGLERRHLRRFSIRASAVVQTMAEGAGQVFQLYTQDISSGGAFFPMEVPLPTGEKVKITLLLSISALEEIRSKTQIVTEGRVVRSTERGVAVAFDEYYTMSPVAV